MAVDAHLVVEVGRGRAARRADQSDAVAAMDALADRDELIGQVITNLGQTLDTVDQRHQQLSELIVELKGWMTDLARDRDTIGDSLSNISDLTEVVDRNKGVHVMMPKAIFAK